MRPRFVWVAALAVVSVLGISPSANGTQPPATATPTAVTHTIFLPLLLQCHSATRRGDPYLSDQGDMLVIHADDAWNACLPDDSGVTIAVIDTGVDLTHPDLKANLTAGYDFVDNDAVPQDGNGHGSNVAGIAAAALNGVGVTGVAPTARIMPVRVLGNSGSGYTSNVAKGIVYAADRAQVLNLSLGATTNSLTLLNAINYAANTKGRLVIAAAGNCGDSNYPVNGCAYPDQPSYPAAYPNVLAVAATTNDDMHASFSTAGSYVGVSAPGVNVYNAYKNNSYAYESGTSQATPHVSGLAALIWAQHPAYTASQLWNLITSTAVDLGAAGQDDEFGAGRIDVANALGIANDGAISLASVPDPVRQHQPADHRAAEIAPGRVIVKFKPVVNATAAGQMLRRLDVDAVDTIDAIGIEVLRAPAGGEWSMIDQLRTQPEVDYAEPDYVMRIEPEQ